MEGYPMGGYPMGGYPMEIQPILTLFLGKGYS